MSYATLATRAVERLLTDYERCLWELDRTRKDLDLSEVSDFDYQQLMRRQRLEGFKADFQAGTHPEDDDDDDY